MGNLYFEKPRKTNAFVIDVDTKRENHGIMIIHYDYGVHSPSEGFV